MVKYMAWTVREEGQACPAVWDEAVRNTADVEIDPKYPLPGWYAGNNIGGSLSVSLERFPGSSPIWYWQA